jgi:hypothetical protein
MSPTDIKPFNHPAAWKASDVAGKEDFAIDLTPRHIGVMQDSLRGFRAALDDTGFPSLDAFPLVTIADDIARWRQELLTGRGLVLLRGFPIDQDDPEDLRLMYLGLGLHFGRPVSQSKMGELIGEVVNIGDKDIRERAYRNSRTLNLHTDRCDHIGMLCVRKAIEGGVSGYASALAVHNEILGSRPDLLAALYNGYHHHRFGEQAPGDPLVTAERIPIFSVTSGVPNVIYIRGYIDLTVEEGHVTLSDVELEALNYFDEVANREDIRLDFLLEPGELNFTNNCFLVHTRTGFEDSPDPAQKRRLLRLWLREDGRPAAPGVIAHKGADGIGAQQNEGTYYTSHRKQWRRGANPASGPVST